MDFSRAFRNIVQPYAAILLALQFHVPFYIDSSDSPHLAEARMISTTATCSEDTLSNDKTKLAIEPLRGPRPGYPYFENHPGPTTFLLDPIKTILPSGRLRRSQYSIHLS